MKFSTFLTAGLALGLSATVHAHEFDFDSGWLHTPEGMETIGNAHGEIGVDSNGLIYVSVAGGDKAGLQVYSADGNYLHNVPNALNNHHGFTIVQEDGKDVIYASGLGGDIAALKLSTDGEVLLKIPTSAIPNSAWGDPAPEKRPKLALTHIDVAPNGNIYIVDGYSSDKIFIFDAKGTYKKTIGGKGAPYNFKNLHKFAVDHRFEPARLLCCDRVNLRLVHLTLDGEVIGDVATDLRRPSSVAFHDDFVAIAEIAGRITVLDKEGKVVAQLGTNDTKGENNTNGVEPARWKEGTVTSPHGISFDNEGNLLMTEWNKWGRVLRWNAKLK